VEYDVIRSYLQNPDAFQDTERIQELKNIARKS